MPEYRRLRVEGGTYFFTVVAYNRQPIFSDPNAREILKQVIKRVQSRHPFQVDAICLLPDHIHCIWTLPECDTDYSMRWREVKRQFTHLYLEKNELAEPLNESREKRKEAAIWQRRFWEHTIRDETDLENHLNYIHFNPVKHGLVNQPEDWEWSSFHRLMKSGVYKPNWEKQIVMPLDFE